MDYKKLADLLYPNTTKTIQDYFNIYPPRNLPAGAEVTRFAPSPTGYLHIGHFCGAMTDQMLAKASNGIFYFRLENTDGKRTIDGADKVALQVLEKFGITPMEGYLLGGQVGDYGPYVQTERVEIYATFAKHLVSIGRAYPCFCKKRENKDEILKDRTEQLSSTNTIETKDPCRDLTLEEIEQHLNNGEDWALRFKSMSKEGETFTYTDLAKGERVIPKNTTDYIIVKSNGIPVYHLGHVVDDILMHTTAVVRGNEWMGTLPLHVEMFEAFGFNPPKYVHTCLIMKKDEVTGNVRKISKRLDPEADMRFYLTSGYPTEAVNRYVMNLINSGYEPWALANPDASLDEYTFNPNNLTTSDPMFDIVKLNDISKTVISKYTTEQVLNNILAWAKEYNPADYEIISGNTDLFKAVLAIDRECERPRKDITKFDEVVKLYDYILPAFEVDTTIDLGNIEPAQLKAFMQDYSNSYAEFADNSAWFAHIKQVALNHNFADAKDYKKNPENYLGTVADAVKFVRFAITGRVNTPELYTIMKTISTAGCKARIERFIQNNL